MQNQIDLSRRHFLKATATVGGGLVIGFYLPGTMMRVMAQTTSAAPPVYPPNAFVQIAPDSSVSIVINKCEMGQGVFTSMSQLIAEELECDWTTVKPVAASVNPIYNHTMYGPSQITGGSSSLISSYTQYRKIGAGARTMLVQAAANKWGVEASTCKAENGFVIHAEKGRLAYGALAEVANKLPMPKDPELKSAKEFKIIGKSLPRLDALAKSTGKAMYGIDVRLPKMVRVMVVRPPVFGATLKKFDDSAATKISGVTKVVRVGDRIAVVARNSWAARQGRDAIKAEWDFHGKDKITHDSIMADFKVLAQKPALTPKSNADAVKEVLGDKHALIAEYELPYLNHAQMEPLNITINYDGKTAELWSGHQMPTFDRNAAAKVFGLPNDKVKLNVMYAGGSFGRRGSKDCDYVIEACEIAKVLKQPMQVLWSREDDMKGGYYRPMAYHKARVSTDAKSGMPKAWHHTVVSQSIMAGGVMAAMMGDGADPTVTEGVTDSAYDLPKMQVDLQMPSLDIPVLWFRSVGHTHTAFVMETLMDELAHRGKHDPLEYRRSMLHKSARHLAVIDLLKKHSPIGKKPAKGHAYGVAVHESFNSVVGHVVEVSVHDGKPKIHQVWSAVHCGRVVNPEGARTQVEGGICFGLTAALYGKIKIENGQVTTQNFNTYPVMRMNEMPKINVHFVESEDNPTGLGEPGVPPIAPAVANALFRLTGQRIRKLPIDLSAKNKA